ncbi:hypothetical protein QFZ75_002117 [Streptomyces sp. V3I8]|nr:hypothetical protein [Streptomyces sp. V3I8]
MGWTGWTGCRAAGLPGCRAAGLPGTTTGRTPEGMRPVVHFPVRGSVYA